MDLAKALAQLEGTDELHEARMLLLLKAFAGKDNSGEITGLTKLAKLDFLLRYPTMLSRALEARGRPAAIVKLQAHEKNSVESTMVRYRFGPWDHRYRRFLNLLTAKKLIRTTIDGRTVKIALTEDGYDCAEQLARLPDFSEIARRSRILKTHFDLTATNLMKLVYDLFPELSSLSPNEPIKP